MKMDDLEILKRHYDARADAYLTLARVKDSGGRSASPRPYALGWQPRAPQIAHRLHEARRYMDEGTARRALARILDEEELPKSGATMPDWQQELVYAWEGDFCCPNMKAINEDEARAIIRVVARDYGMKPPKLIMTQDRDSSAYIGPDHTIRFGHRDNIGLLHELAHAVCEPKIEDTEAAAHSPLFVWTLIELYHRYAGLNLNYMIISAASRGLTGDMNAEQIVEPSVKFRLPNMAPRRKAGPS
jgi:hypothetical protein